MHDPWDKAAFRRLLRRIMKDAGLSQQDVADAAGISRPQVSRWTTGSHRPNYDAISRFATELRRDHPDMADLATGLVHAAGYERPAVTDQPAPTPADAGRPRYADPAKDRLAEEVWRRKYGTKGQLLFDDDVLRGVVEYMWQMSISEPGEANGGHERAVG